MDVKFIDGELLIFRDDVWEISEEEREWLLQEGENILSSKGIQNFGLINASFHECEGKVSLELWYSREVPYQDSWVEKSFKLNAGNCGTLKVEGDDYWSTKDFDRRLTEAIRDACNERVGKKHPGAQFVGVVRVKAGKEERQNSITLSGELMLWEILKLPVRLCSGHEWFKALSTASSEDGRINP